MGKPILKKLSSSAKVSLDLDRGWEDQKVSQVLVAEPGRSGKDVSFNFPTWNNLGSRSASGSGTATPLGGMSHELGGFDRIGAGSRSGSRSRGRFHSHTRSPSGTSVGTSGSGVGGSFVHPFQQPPRTNTPQMTNNDDTFEDDMWGGRAGAYPSSLSTATHHMQYSGTSKPLPASSALQRSESFGDFNNPSISNHHPTTHTQIPQSYTTSRPIFSSSSSRYGRDSPSLLNTSYSQSDLHRQGTSGTESPRPSFSNPAHSSVLPMSPIRNSLDNMGFRLRSNSEVVVDGGIREARRKFQEHERMKEEKYEAEQTKKRERKDTKEAAKLEKAARKNTMGSDTSPPSLSRNRTPTTLDPRISSSRHGSPRRGRGNDLTRNRTASSSLSLTLSGAAGTTMMNEKASEFQSTKYDNADQGRTPTLARPDDVNDVHFIAPPKRKNTAKKKTQTFWQSFMLWLRTRLLHLERR